MPQPSVDSTSPPTQEALGVFLGEFHPARGTRLTLEEWRGQVTLWRHRNPANSDPGADPAASVTAVDGRIDVDWDPWHRKHKPAWMATVEDWVRDTLGAS
jgi:hypothetical protein